MLLPCSASMYKCVMPAETWFLVFSVVNSKNKDFGKRVFFTVFRPASLLGLHAMQFTQLRILQQRMVADSSKPYCTFRISFLRRISIFLLRWSALFNLQLQNVKQALKRAHLFCNFSGCCLIFLRVTCHPLSLNKHEEYSATEGIWNGKKLVDFIRLVCLVIAYPACFISFILSVFCSDFPTVILTWLV